MRPLSFPTLKGGNFLAVYCKTPVLHTYRGTEIFCYLAEISDTKFNKHSGIGSFCVLDDDYDPVYDFIAERWVTVDSKKGLTESSAEKAIKILNTPYTKLQF